MKIVFIPERTYGKKYEHRKCCDMENLGTCHHNDDEERLEFGKEVIVENQRVWVSLEVLYCPYCGFSYKGKK